MNLSLNNLNVLHRESPSAGSETPASTPSAPASTPVSAASGIDLEAVGRYVIGNPGAIQLKGFDAMQNVSPGSTGHLPSGGTSGPSAECNDGVLANVGKAIGSTVEGDVVGESEIGGAAGQYIGASACEAGKAAASLFDTGPDSNSYSYDDPDTGERITNDTTSTGDTVTTAGDTNAPKGDYIGEADDPNFVNAGTEDSSKNQSTNADNNTNQSSASGTDTNSSQSTQQTSDNNSTQNTDNVNETLQSSDPGGSKPGGNNLPADDSSGNTGPAGPRANIYQSVASTADFMPADDAAGGPGPGGPRSNVYQNVAGAADFMPADDTTGNPGPAGPRSNVSTETVSAQNLALNAAQTRGIIIIGG